MELLKKSLNKSFIALSLAIALTIFLSGCARYKAEPLEDFTDDTSLLDDQENFDEQNENY